MNKALCMAILALCTLAACGNKKTKSCKDCCHDEKKTEVVAEESTEKRVSGPFPKEVDFEKEDYK